MLARVKRRRLVPLENRRHSPIGSSSLHDLANLLSRIKKASVRETLNRSDPLRIPTTVCNNGEFPTTVEFVRLNRHPTSGCREGLLLNRDERSGRLANKKISACNM